MSLLEDIQHAAVSADGNIGQLLRQCKLLAARLNSKPLEDWLVLESNGYPEGAELPPYRVWSLQLKGHFFGSFGSQIRNAPIPAVCIPPKAKEGMTHFRCNNSISSIEAMLKDGESEGIFRALRGDLNILLSDKVYDGYGCVDAWGEFGSIRFTEVLNTVRNQILDFAIAIWKEDPCAGDISSTAPQIAPQKVTQIFNTTVHGGSANIVGEANASTIAFNIKTSDFDSLENFLKSKNVEDTDIKELHTAISEDPQPTVCNKFGPKVSHWISKMVGKAAQGIWDISLNTVGTVLGSALCKYYGIQ